MFNQEFNCQNIFKRELIKIINSFPHTKQESIKTTDANEGSIKIERKVLKPKAGGQEFQAILALF
jgi:hypothetical protein